MGRRGLCVCPGCSSCLLQALRPCVLGLGICGVDVPGGSLQLGGGQDMEDKYPRFGAVKGGKQVILLWQLGPHGNLAPTLWCL